MGYDEEVLEPASIGYISPEYPVESVDELVESEEDQKEDEVELLELLSPGYSPDELEPSSEDEVELPASAQ